MKVGELLIDMAADVARLRADMNTAQGVVSSAVNKMQSTVDGLKKGIAGLAAGLTVGAFAAAIKNQLELADAIAKTAERTGLQIKDVAGLQLAYSMAGVSSDKLETSLGKMAKNMAEGSKAFGAMGVQIKNSDGSLRSTRDVLGDVADKFASYRDGAEKTALAQELFGKSGTEMISVLNGGAEALAESDAQARRLGLTLDEEATAKAVQFNDTLSLLQAGGEGFTRQIAGRLAPTLASLASELLSNVGQSESLNTISAALSTTLKGLYSAGAIGAQIFANLGRAVGAGAAAIMAVLRGDFAAAKDIMSDVSSVNAAAWKGQLESLGRLWDDTGAAGVQAMATVASAARNAAPVVTKPGKDAAKSLKEAKDVAWELFQELRAKDVGLDKKYYDQLAQLNGLYTSGRITLDEYREAVTELTDRQQFAKDIVKANVDAYEELIATIQKASDTEAAQLKSAADMLAAIEFETEALRMNATEREVATAMRELERQGIVKGTEAWETYAQKIRDGIVTREGVRASVEAMKEVDAEAKKTAEGIGNSITDALMRGFEGGKDVARNFRDTLINMFKTLVLRPVIKMMVAPVAGAITGALGLSSAAQAGQGGGEAGGGGGGNAISSIWSLMNGSSITNMATGWISNLGANMGGEIGAKLAMNSEFLGSIVGGVGNAFAGYGISKALSGGYSAGGWVNIAAGAASAIPGIGPIAGVIGGLVNRAFGRKLADWGIEGTLGGEAGFAGDAYQFYKGGWFRDDKTKREALDPTLVRTMGAAWKAIEAQVTNFADVLGLQADRIDGFSTAFKFSTKDLDPKSPTYQQDITAKINEALTKGSDEMAQRILGTWTTTTREVEETIKTGFWDDETFTTVKKTVEETTYTASEYAREGERAIDTLTRLATSLKTVNSAFDMLGLSLYEASLAGGDMASALVDKMGGKDAFTAQIGSYWQAYYSEAERAEYLNAQMARTLAAVGLELPTNIAGFRALVEAQDRNTDSGRAAFAALMSINGAFAELHPNAEAAAVAVDEVGNALSRGMVDLLAEHDRLQADLLQAQGDLDGSAAARRAIAIAGYTAEEVAAYDANQALRDQIAAIQQFSGIVGGISNSLASLIQDGLLGNLSAADLGGRMADVVIGGVYNAMASGFSQQITSMLMNGLVTPMVQAALVGTSVSEAVSRAAIDKMMAQATAVAQALGAVLSDPAFRDAMSQVQGVMQELAASIAPPQAYYTNWDTQQQMAAQAAQEAQRLADQQAQAAQRAADEAAQRQQAILNERTGLTKQLLQLEGNTNLLREMELAALDPSNRALQQRIWAIEDETAAAEKYKSALKDAQDFLGGFTKNIEEFIFKVSHAQADAQQSYQMAAAKFTAQMTLARGGDRDAMNGITGYADTLIGSIRRESTTGAEANLRIARVLGQLASLPKQISAEQLIVDAIVNAKTSLETVLSTNFASLDANVDGLLTASELAASGLATNTQIAALMARVDANGDGMISKQELANSRLQTLATEQCTTNTNLGNVTAAQQAANTWLGLIHTSDASYSTGNINAINAGANATVAALNKTNANVGTLVRSYDTPVVAQFSSDSPLFSIFAAIDETNSWLYKLHGLSTASVYYWVAMLDNSRPVTVRSENRTPDNGSVFADGGFTGYGGKWEPAGLVHRGEVVWSQADVARWGGPGIVDALRQGAPGYADGGPVAVRVPQIYVPPVGRSNEETQALLREVLAELRAQRSDDRARHNSLAEPLQRMDRRGAKWDKDGLPAERTNEAIA